MISDYLLWKARDLTIYAGRRAEKSGTVVDMNFDLARTGIGSPTK